MQFTSHIKGVTFEPYCIRKTIITFMIYFSLVNQRQLKCNFKNFLVQ